MDELFQLQASSSVTARVHQVYSVATDATEQVMALIDSLEYLVYYQSEIKFDSIRTFYFSDYHCQQLRKIHIICWFDLLIVSPHTIPFGCCKLSGFLT